MRAAVDAARPLHPFQAMPAALSLQPSPAGDELVADGAVAVPRATLEITQIYTPRTCDVALTRELVAATRCVPRPAIGEKDSIYSVYALASLPHRRSDTLFRAYSTAHVATNTPLCAIVTRRSQLLLLLSPAAASACRLTRVSSRWTSTAASYPSVSLTHVLSLPPSSAATSAVPPRPPTPASGQRARTFSTAGPTRPAPPRVPARASSCSWRHPGPGTSHATSAAPRSPASPCRSSPSRLSCHGAPRLATPVPSPPRACRACPWRPRLPGGVLRRPPSVLLRRGPARFPESGREPRPMTQRWWGQVRVRHNRPGRGVRTCAVTQTRGRRRPRRRRCADLRMRTSRLAGTGPPGHCLTAPSQPPPSLTPLTLRSERCRGRPLRRSRRRRGRLPGLRVRRRSMWLRGRRPKSDQGRVPGRPGTRSPGFLPQTRASGVACRAFPGCA